MTTQLSSRMSQFNASASVALAAKVIELKSQGREIISLNIGEPDFPTPENIKAAGIRAISENFTKYTTNLGLPELRDAIVKKLSTENGINYSADCIAITVGAKQALMNALYALLDEGDEVIIPIPCYVSYPDMVLLAGGIPVLIPILRDSALCSGVCIHFSLRAVST